MRPFLVIALVGTIVYVDVLTLEIQSCSDVTDVPAGSEELRLSSNSPCSVTCGGGQRWSTVMVLYYEASNGDPLIQCQETAGFQACNDDPCPDSIHGSWSEWGQWTFDRFRSCTACCGLGIQGEFRRRRCNNPAPSPGGDDCRGRKRQERIVNCYNGPCPVVGHWSRWSVAENGVCNATCGGGFQNQLRNRACDNPAPAHGGDDCVGGNQTTEMVPCNSQSCSAVKGQWGDWTMADNGSCSVTCGCGQRILKRSRSCEITSPDNGGGVCEGDSESAEIVPCNNVACPASDSLNACSGAVLGSMVATLAALLLLLCCLVIYFKCCKSKTQVDNGPRVNSPERRAQSADVEMRTFPHARPNVPPEGTSPTRAEMFSRRTRTDLDQRRPWIY